MSLQSFFDIKLDDPEEISLLKKYDNLYYNEGTSPISDEEYDSLKDKAKELYPKNPYFLMVGFTVPGSKMTLPYILGSLKKVKVDDIENWLNKNIDGEYLISEKLDGVSIYVHYRNGKVFASMTRGNGYEGKDITKKARIFCPEIDFKGNLMLRGEAMLMGDDHTSIGYKTRRNGVAGILNRDDDKFCDKITPFFYEVLDCDDALFTRASEEEKMISLLGTIDVDVPNFIKTNNKSANYLIEVLKQFKKNSLDCQYDIDGLVIKPVDYKREDVYYPELSVAFKVNDLPIPVDVLSIEWNVSRTGKVKPIVNIRPTIIGGVTVSKATGFNAEFIKLNKIDKGSIIEIQRSGDVIPHIVNVVKIASEIKLIEKCPSCGSDLSWKGVDIVCSSENCIDSKYKKVSYFLRKMGAENITEVTCRKLGLFNIEDCYKISELDIAKFDGFGINRGSQIVNEIKFTLSSTPEKFISALGINGVSDVIAKSIVEYCRNINSNDYDLMKEIFSIDEDSLIDIDGIGYIIAENFVTEIQNYYDLLEYLYSVGLKWKSQNRTNISGKIFTLTGKGEFTRQEYHSIITNNGGIVKGMSKNTHYLVAADTNTDSSKAKKARQYGVRIITYKELMELIDE
jgi:DNA ligase (NAD+)